MKRFILIALLLVITAGALHAQYDITKIYMERARSMEMRRQFDEANQIYRELLKDNPTHAPAIEKLIRNLLLQSKTEDASEVMQQYGSALPLAARVRNQLSIILKNSDFKGAERYAREQAKQHPDDIALHSEISAIFEAYREYSNAIHYLLKAREISGIEDSYHLELSRMYQAEGQFDEAIPELFAQLKSQPGYFHYVNRQIKEMILVKPDIVNVIRDKTLESGDPLLVEIYAKALIETGDLDAAFRIYNDLAPEKLLSFADERVAAGDYLLAQRAYNNFIAKTPNVLNTADARIMLARIAIAQDSLRLAEEILQDIRSNADLSRGSNLYRLKANLEARELLANLALIQQKESDVVVEFLNEAVACTMNHREKKRIGFEIVNFYLLNKQFEQADNELSQILRGEETGSETETTSFYYRFLSYAFQSDARADTLLNMMIVRDAGMENVNDALNLTNMIKDLGEEERALFLDAFCAFSLFRFDEAFAKISQLIEKSNGEAYRLLATEWAIMSGRKQYALELLEYPYENEIYAGYANLLKLDLADTPQQKQDIAIMFLTEHDQSVFAPAVRGYIQTKSSE